MVVVEADHNSRDINAKYISERMREVGQAQGSLSLFVNSASVLE